MTAAGARPVSGGWSRGVGFQSCRRSDFPKIRLEADCVVRPPRVRTSSAGIVRMRSATAELRSAGAGVLVSYRTSHGARDGVDRHAPSRCRGLGISIRRARSASQHSGPRPWGSRFRWVSSRPIPYGRSVRQEKDSHDHRECRHPVHRHRRIDRAVPEPFAGRRRRSPPRSLFHPAPGDRGEGRCRGEEPGRWRDGCLRLGIGRPRMRSRHAAGCRTGQSQESAPGRRAADRTQWRRGRPRGRRLLG